MKRLRLLLLYRELAILRTISASQLPPLSFWTGLRHAYRLVSRQPEYRRCSWRRMKRAWQEAQRRKIAEKLAEDLARVVGMPFNRGAAASADYSYASARLDHQAYERYGCKKMRAKDRPLENDFVSAEAFDEMLRVWFANAARVLKPGGSFHIWGGYANLGNYPAPLKAAGLYFSQGIVWDKQHPVLTRKDMMGCFELAFYGWKEGAGHHFFGPNNATDLWHVKKVNPQSMIHLTEKPVELAVRAIQYSSRPGENVLDLFGGSGSTLIAAEQTGRRCFMMEIDPPYCDVIVKRWSEFTGRMAERIETEATPPETAGASRRKPECV